VENVPLCLPVAILDNDLAPRDQNISISLPITLFEQEPCSPQPHLSLSMNKEIAFQESSNSHPSEYLSFAGANAIIYGCMTIAALHFMLTNLGQDIRTIDLAYEMGVAFLLGPILCVSVHLYASGWLRYGSGTLLWAVGDVVGRVSLWIAECSEAMYNELAQLLE
jgi:hypothetical protein